MDGRTVPVGPSAAPAALVDGGDDVRVSLRSGVLAENTIAIHPLDRDVVLCANVLRSANDVEIAWSSDGGQTWEDTVISAARADPAAAIDRAGNFYVGFIGSPFDQQMVAVSSDRGASWVLQGLGRSGDKNHLAVDVGAASPFVGRLYSAWTSNGGGGAGEVHLARSLDGAASWSVPRNISGQSQAHPIGVNLGLGPDGELYACWALIPPVPPARAFALGFNASFDGSLTFGAPGVILDGLHGITSGDLPNTSIAVNSLPSMAIDRGEGPRRGWIYVFTTSAGVPGGAPGDADIYMLRSRDRGLTWDEPVRVDDDPDGRSQWDVWAACDDRTGALYATFFDRREDPAELLARSWLARSVDGGVTWQDQPVGDVLFEPRGAGVGGTWMGDYLGLAAHDGRVLPLWSDWRTGQLTAFTAPLFFDSFPPTIVCPPDRTLEASADGGVRLEDPAMVGFLAAASASDADSPPVQLSHDAPALVPLGVNRITFTARDAAGNESLCSAILTVQDTRAPQLSATFAPRVLTPADHRLVTIDVDLSVVDAGDARAGFRLASITSTERDSGLGAGDLPGDVQGAELGTADTEFQLRAELGAGSRGRTYTIKYASADRSGNGSALTLAVRVGVGRKP